MIAYLLWYGRSFGGLWLQRLGWRGLGLWHMDVGAERRAEPVTSPMKATDSLNGDREIKPCERLLRVSGTLMPRLDGKLS